MEKIICQIFSRVLSLTVHVQHRGPPVPVSARTSSSDRSRDTLQMDHSPARSFITDQSISSGHKPSALCPPAVNVSTIKSNKHEPPCHLCTTADSQTITVLSRGQTWKVIKATLCPRSTPSPCHCLRTSEVKMWNQVDFNIFISPLLTTECRCFWDVTFGVKTEIVKKKKKLLKKIDNISPKIDL